MGCLPGGSRQNYQFIEVGKVRGKLAGEIETKEGWMKLKEKRPLGGGGWRAIDRNFIHAT